MLALVRALAPLGAERREAVAELLLTLVRQDNLAELTNADAPGAPDPVADAVAQ